MCVCVFVFVFARALYVLKYHNYSSSDCHCCRVLSLGFLVAFFFCCVCVCVRVRVRECVCVPKTICQTSARVLHYKNAHKLKKRRSEDWQVQGEEAPPPPLWYTTVNDRRSILVEHFIAMDANEVGLSIHILVRDCGVSREATVLAHPQNRKSTARVNE